MPCEIVPLRVDFFKMAAVAMETAKMLKKHNKPKWSQYGAACLTPCKYPFPLKSFHF
jgi:hypothetical protein